MTKTKFKHDFLRGLGSSLIELQSCDNPGQFSEIVLYGCTHNTTYDMQCEGDRGWYLYQAAQLAGNKEAIEVAVVNKFFRIREDHWMFDQLTSILYHFAADGSQTARAALYQQYEGILNELSPKKKKVIKKEFCVYPRRDMFEWLCVWLTSLDGWSAFKRIVQDISEILLPQDEDGFFFEWFYSNSKGKFGEKRVDGYLQKQAERSPFIIAYYEKAKAWDNHVYQKTPEPTLDDVLAASNGEKFHGRGTAMRFARTASESDIEKLMEIALQEPNELRKAELLWGLRKAKYPFSDNFIAELLKSENEDIRDTAFYIMEQAPSPKMREYALTLLQKGEETVNAISLLAKNLLPQDEQFFCEKVKSLPIKFSKGDWHGAFMSAESGISGMKFRPKTDVLEYMHRETFCGSCRERIVRIMHKKRVLSEPVLQECLYDSNSDIRIFAERIIKSRKGTPIIQ